MDLELTYPDLADLLCGGFNQDYEDIFGDVEDVIALYTSDPVFCVRIPLEVERILAEYEGAALDEALSSLHNGYWYELHGQTAREFLELVADRARAGAAVPEEPYASLIGQRISSVDWLETTFLQHLRRVVARPAVGGNVGPPVAVGVGDSVVEFTSGMLCSMSGARGIGDVERVRSVLGHEVLWVGTAGAGVVVATATARMFTPQGPNAPDPAFELRRVQG